MVRASLCKRCLHVKECDLKPKDGVRNITACISFCQSHDVSHEEIIEQLDFIRMKKMLPDKPKPPV
jgi:hypothetical protein